MSVDFRSAGHSGDESHHYYRQATAPTTADPLQVGDLWSDTTANVLKRCTSLSPVTFVSVEGGSAAHNLFSSTHGDVDETDTPADDEVLTYDSVGGSWRAEPASGHGSHPTNHADLGGIGADNHHAQDHAARHADGGADELAVQDLASDAATDGQVARANGSGGVAFEDDKLVINFIIDGGGAAITTGEKGHIEIPFGMLIEGWSILADQSGSIVVDVWKDTYANFPPTVADTIAGSEKPTLSTAQKNQDLSLSTWTTSVSAGDILAFNVDSAASVQRITISYKGAQDLMPSHIYIAPWEEILERGRPGYVAPGGDALGVLDLRSLPQMGSPGQVGYGLFVYQEQRVIAGGHYLGADPQRELSLTDRSAIETFLGVTLAETQLLKVIRELFLVHYDPTGQDRWKPLRTGRRSGMKLYLGGYGLLLHESFSVSHPAFQATLDVRQADYRRLKQAGASLEALRRWTGYDMLKLFGRMGDDLLPALVPAEHQADGWRSPQTTFSESWPTNSSTLSSGQDQPWTEEIGDLEVVGGVLRAAVANADPKWVSCDTQLSSDDHEHDADAAWGADANDLKVLVRAVRGSGSDVITGYAMQGFRETGFNARRLQKVVNSVLTDLSVDSNDPGASATIHVKADGSNISGSIGAATFGPVTDTAITGNLKIGAWVVPENTTANATLDNHVAADLPVGTPHSQAVIVG